MFSYNLLACVLWFCFSPLAFALELRVVAAEFWGPPYVFSGKEIAKKGIVKELVEAFAKEAKVSVVYINLPRKRIETELKNGSVHIAPISNPGWYADHNGLDWSDPVFEEKNQFVLMQDGKLKIDSVQDLRGKKLGAMLGFVYPNLTTEIQSGAVTRVDVKDYVQITRMLKKGRVDTFVTSDIVFRYMKKINPEAQKLRVADFVLAQHSIHWCVAKSAPITVQQINEILAKLKSSGKVAEIMKKYLD